MDQSKVYVGKRGESPATVPPEGRQRPTPGGGQHPICRGPLDDPENGLIDLPRPFPAARHVLDRLQSVRAVLSGTDTHSIIDREDEYLAVADLPCPSRFLNGSDDHIDLLVGDQDI